MNISTIKENTCSGCSGCMAICPKKAIKMIANDKGFLVPFVNKDLCIDCGLCIKLCNDKINYRKEPIAAYGFQHASDDVKKKSSSGGASRALIEQIVAVGGVVYGVSYTTDFEVVISRAQTLKECDAFYGSKYVSVNPQDSFEKVYDDLRTDRKVLFICTSCYIAGLLSYLKLKKCPTNHLITVDIICHGVPSPQIFKEYIEFINKKKNLKAVNFRSKKLPWKYGTYSCLLVRKNGREEFNTLRARLFFNLFCSSACLRECCYKCSYASEGRSGDITISDFWGIEKKHPEFYSEKGVSAMIVNSSKGEELLKKITGCSILQTKPEYVLAHNLNKPTKKSEYEQDFWNTYFEKGFKAIARKYGDYSVRGYIRKSWIHDIWVKIRYGKKV